LIFTTSPIGENCLNLFDLNVNHVDDNLIYVLEASLFAFLDYFDDQKEYPRRKKL
jgi:hypothetical protein